SADIVQLPDLLPKATLEKFTADTGVQLYWSAVLCLFALSTQGCRQVSSHRARAVVVCARCQMPYVAYRQQIRPISESCSGLACRQDKTVHLVRKVRTPLVPQWLRAALHPTS